MTQAQTRPSGPVPPALSPEPVQEADFIAQAEAFIQRRRDHPAFRLLRVFLGCTADELESVIGAAYCACLPANTIPVTESAARTAFGLPAMPLMYLGAKRWWWTPEPRVQYALETIDPDYFNRWFSKLYEALPAPKRLSPRAPDGFSRPDLSLPCDASVRLGDLLRLGALMPFLFPALAALSLAEGLNLLKTCRQAIASYLIFRGYFRRYPCRHFITFEDYPNYPARHIAFRQSCDGDLIAVQNGERSHLPQFAFGRVDQYFIFGDKFAEILRGLKVRARNFIPVGALGLNDRHELYSRETAGGPPDILYDILFIDQGVYPHNGTPAYFGEALARLLDNLGTLGRRHPELRLVYQLRYYPPEERHKTAAVEELLRTRCPGAFTILENRGNGESYRNILHANLTVTFESTLGFEALMMGKKALFVNYSGNPGESLCRDPRFQISDPQADYALLESRVLELLKMELAEIPEAARERHHAFDGKVQERIAAHLLRGPASHSTDEPART